MAGRPPRDDPKFTPEACKRICDLIRAGNRLETASASAGIDPTTLRRWLRKGERGLAPWREFSEDVKRAHAEAEVAGVVVLRTAGRRDWHAMAWWLERTRPEHFGQTVMVRAKVEAELDGIVERLRTRLDAETFRRVAEVLLASGEDPEGGG